MGSIITLIFIGIFIYNIVKAAETAKPKNPQGRPNTQQTRRYQSGQYRAGQKQPAQNAYYYQQQQRATKDRLQQRYGKQVKSDILSRAKNNVQETAPDRVEQELHTEVCRDYKEHAAAAIDVNVHKAMSPVCDTAESSDIIKRVNDLIITGYSGEMNFERDFIAEGVEMLNSFGI